MTAREQVREQGRAVSQALRAKVIPMTQPSSNNLGEWAVFYPERLGLAVFPLVPRNKLPLFSKEQGGNGVHDATTDVDTIRAWWTEHPRANIGIACGEGRDSATFGVAGSTPTHWFATGSGSRIGCFFEPGANSGISKTLRTSLSG